jgi:hypothetical protein
MARSLTPHVFGRPVSWAGRGPFGRLHPEPARAAGRVVQHRRAGGQANLLRRRPGGLWPGPKEIRALIRERGIPTIYGKHDHAIARDLEDCGRACVDPHDRQLGPQSVDWTLARTDQPSRDFMRELPFDLRFEIGDAAVHLVHGSRKVNA